MTKVTIEQIENAVTEADALKILAHQAEMASQAAHFEYKTAAQEIEKAQKSGDDEKLCAAYLQEEEAKEESDAAEGRAKHYYAAASVAADEADRLIKLYEQS